MNKMLGAEPLPNHFFVKYLCICLLFCHLPLQAHAILCSEIFGSRASTRFFSPDADTSTLRQGESLRLGEGGEGILTLHRTVTGELIVEKSFISVQDGRPDPARASQNLRNIQNLEGWRDDGLLGGFKVVRVRNHRDHVLEMDYIPGRTVRDIFRDDTFPSALKQQIMDKYERFVDQVYDAWRVRPIKLSPSRINGLRFLYVMSRNGRELITIDPYNIVVDARNLDLVIIDPY